MWKTPKTTETPFSYGRNGRGMVETRKGERSEAKTGEKTKGGNKKMGKLLHFTPRKPPQMAATAYSAPVVQSPVVVPMIRVAKPLDALNRVQERRFYYLQECGRVADAVREDLAEWED